MSKVEWLTNRPIRDLMHLVLYKHGYLLDKICISGHHVKSGRWDVIARSIMVLDLQQWEEYIPLPMNTAVPEKGLFFDIV